MDAVREAVSYVSRDFVSEMHSTKRKRQVNGCQATPVEFVLPDYKYITKVSRIIAKFNNKPPSPCYEAV